MFRTNEPVITPDGPGIIRDLKKNAQGRVVATCLLETPFRINDAGECTKDYGFPPYSLGYEYPVDQLVSAMLPVAALYGQYIA